MIKVAISIGTMQIGGAEVFVVNLLKKLDYKKFDVLLIVLSKKYSTHLEQEIKDLPIQIIYMNKKEGFRPLVMFKIYRVLKKFKPDILHGNIGGLIYFLLYMYMNKDIKLIHTSHTLANLEFNKLKRKIIKRFIIKNRIVPVAISQQVKKSIISTYHINENFIYLIINGIDVKKFYQQRKYELNPLVIGHVGRFEKVKNHETIINVYKELLSLRYNVKLKLIGDGSLFKKIENDVQGLNVKMVRSSNKINEELKEIDIFFFPSLYEGMPLSLLEAIASGAVIIASKVGGISDIVENDINGYLLENCYDIKGFVNVFENLINNKDKLIEISKNNIEKAKQFDLDKMVKQYQDLYQQEVKHAKW